MKKLPIFLIICLIGLVSVVNAENVTVTFSDLNLVKGVKILIYTADGRFIGEYNTTDSVVLNASQSYIFVLKPSEQVWFSDPFQAVELLKASFPSMLSYALFFTVIVASAYIIKKVIVG